MYNHLEITDLKDMLNKTRKLYGNKSAYKIKIVHDIFCKSDLYA